MAQLFNPPPNWPVPPSGWTPPPGWQPNPKWGPVPDGWLLWGEDDAQSSHPGVSKRRFGAVGAWAAGHRTLAVGGALLLLIATVSAIDGADGSDDSAESTQAVVLVTESPTVQPTRSATRRPVATRTTPAPVVTTKTVVETEAVPFAATTRDDPTLAAGTRAVTTVGVAGIRTITYAVVYTDGVETSRSVVSDEVTTPPVDEVTSVGTFVAPPPPPPPPPAPDPPPAGQGGCDPNYTGACVPIDSDVDCAGGGGNGPSYVHGPVTVVGSDIYDLDRDGDGVGCDS